MSDTVPDVLVTTDSWGVFTHGIKALRGYVRARAHESVLLLPKAPRKKAVRNEDWKLLVNAEVELDL